MTVPSIIPRRGVQDQLLHHHRPWHYSQCRRPSLWGIPSSNVVSGAAVVVSTGFIIARMGSYLNNKYHISFARVRLSPSRPPVGVASNVSQLQSDQITRTTSRHVVMGNRRRSSNYKGSGDLCRRWVHHGPQRPSSSPWERKAVQVKNTDLNNPYLDLIRDTHDPSMQLKTMEEELKGTIGKALGKQGDKILYALERLQEEYQQYQTLLEQHDNDCHHPQVVERAQQYNTVRQQAIQARWELLVHRQAVGLIVNNHMYIMKHYPIPDAIVVPGGGNNTTDKANNNSSSNNKKKEDEDLSSSSSVHGSTTSNNNNTGDKEQEKEEEKKPSRKVFGDQLSWWQNVGRWR